MSYDLHRARRDALEQARSNAESIPRTLVDACTLAAAGESCRTCKHFRARILTPCRCVNKNKPVAHYNICEFWREK